MALETTYAYDFPDLFKRNMIDIWNEHRARFPNSVHPPDSEICTNQVNKLKLTRIFGAFGPIMFALRVWVGFRASRRGETGTPTS